MLTISAATIDRALRDIRQQAGTATRRRSPPSAAIRRSVPVRTFDGWNDPSPGFVEADLVAHSGPVARGSFVQTLVLTDIATGWTECAPLLVREQRLLTEVLSELRKLLPFPLLGLDTDNDSVFMNEIVRDYCEQAGIEFNRRFRHIANSAAPLAAASCISSIVTGGSLGLMRPRRAEAGSFGSRTTLPFG